MPRPTFYNLLIETAEERLLALQNLEFKHPADVAAQQFFTQCIKNLINEINKIPHQDEFKGLKHGSSIYDEFNAPLLNKIVELINDVKKKLFDYLLVHTNITGVTYANLQNSFLSWTDSYIHTIQEYRGMINALPTNEYSGKATYLALLKDKHHRDNMVSVLTDIVRRLDAAASISTLDNDSVRTIEACKKAATESSVAIRWLHEPDENNTDKFNSLLTYKLAITQMALTNLQTQKALNWLLLDNNQPTSLQTSIQTFNATLGSDISYIAKNREVILQLDENSSKKVTDLQSQFKDPRKMQFMTDKQFAEQTKNKNTARENNQFFKNPSSIIDPQKRLRRDAIGNSLPVKKK
jgi:hypothetical protein